MLGIKEAQMRSVGKQAKSLTQIKRLIGSFSDNVQKITWKCRIRQRFARQSKIFKVEFKGSSHLLPKISKSKMV